MLWLLGLALISECKGKSRRAKDVTMVWMQYLVLPPVPPEARSDAISRPKSFPGQVQMVPAAASLAAVPGLYARETASPEITARPQTSVPSQPVWHQCEIWMGTRGLLKGFFNIPFAVLRGKPLLVAQVLHVVLWGTFLL